MATVAGVDCSTQSTKVVVCDADTGEVLAQRSGPHPEGTEVDPAAWWQALAAPRAAPAATELVGERGGPAAWAVAVGSVPVASCTVTKLGWLAENEPERAGRV